MQRHLAPSSCSVTQRRSIDVIRERKQRRRSARRASLCLRNQAGDKENQCLSSTPTSKFISSSQDYPDGAKALRDVSNITPKTHLPGAPANQRTIDTITTSNLSPQRTLIRQRKKQCLNPDHVNYTSVHEIKKILLNDGNINGHVCGSCEVLPNIEQTEIESDAIRTTFASTLPSIPMGYSPCSLRNIRNPSDVNPSRPTFPYQSLTTLPQFKSVLQDTCSPNKKPKIDHVNDFLHQISFITSPEDFRIRNTKLLERQGNNHSEITVSPLLRKISDLRFSKISYTQDEKVPAQSSAFDDSVAFNDMSLDKIVDAILDTTMGSERLELRDEHKESDELLRRENEANQVSEENLVNNAQEIQAIHRDTYLLRTETSDIVDSLNRSNNITQIANIDEDTSKRKRTISCTELSVKKRYTESMSDISFTLKRQKCIRRRKTMLNPLNNNVLSDETHYDETPTSTLKEINQNDIEMEQASLSYKEGLNDNSFSSSCISAKNASSLHMDSIAYSSWENEMCCGLSTPFLENGKSFATERKRVLRRSTSSPITVAASSTPTRSRDSSVTGSVDLQIQYKNGKLTVHGK